MNCLQTYQILIYQFKNTKQKHNILCVANDDGIIKYKCFQC